jgi:hypothetical protein
VYSFLYALSLHSYWDSGTTRLYNETRLVRLDVSNTSLTGDLPSFPNNDFLRDVNLERTQLRSSTRTELPSWVDIVGANGTADGASNSTFGEDVNDPRFASPLLVFA